MENSSLPIIQTAVPEKIYGGYSPQPVYDPSAGDSEFYELFIRQMNGNGAGGSSPVGTSAGGSGRSEADRIDADRIEAAREKAETGGQDKNKSGEAAPAEQGPKNAGGSERAGSEETRGESDGGGKESRRVEAGEAGEETAKAAGGKDGDKEVRNETGLFSKDVLNKADGTAGDDKDKASLAEAMQKTAGKNRKEKNGGDPVWAGEEDSEEMVSGSKDKNGDERLRSGDGKNKSGLKEGDDLNLGVIELNLTGRKELSGEKDVKDSDRKVKKESELLHKGESEKRRVVIEDRRTVKTIEKQSNSAQWKKDGAQTEKQNLELRNAVKEELLDKNEKIIRIGNEQLEKLQDNMQNGRTLASGRSAGQPHSSSELLRQLRESGNRQIVKHTGIILKDNNSGEIKLVLKPENLGDVRIRLQLSENSITGKILVDNQMVRAAFEQNLEALYRAFKESGFETASLDVQVGGETGHGKGKEEGGESEYAERKIKFLEEQIPLTNAGNFADTLIDLVV